MGHQRLEETDAVHAWHLDVQREHIRTELDDHVAGDVRVGGGADHLDSRFLT
jgi:hypothetical protein